MIVLPLLILVGVYVCICAYLYFFQNKFIYYPTREFVATPDQMGLAYDDVTVDIGANDKIDGWYVPGRPDQKTILFLHGNGGNVSHRLKHLEMLHGIGASVVIIDYRGYGRSTGSPSEQHVYEDAEAAYQWLIKSKQLRPDQIVIVGESIGGAVAIDLASRVQCAGIIIESSFVSLRSMAGRVFSFLPTGLLLRSDFNSVDKLARVSCPVFMAHSPQDDIVPYDEGVRLYAAAKPPKRFFKLSGGHNDREFLGDPEYVRAVASFLADPASAR